MSDPRWRHGLRAIPSTLWRRRTAIGLWGAVGALGLGLGIASYWLESYYSTRYLAGAALSSWQNFLRLGAPWPALLPPVLAGGLALIGWIRLPRATPQPTIGWPRLERMSTSQLRGGLRRERRGVLLAGDIVVALVVIVAARLPVYITLALWGLHLAQASLAGVAVEALVWLACGGCFVLWRRRYLATLETWGVAGDR